MRHGGSFRQGLKDAHSANFTVSPDMRLTCIRHIHHSTGVCGVAPTAVTSALPLTFQRRISYARLVAMPRLGCYLLLGACVAILPVVAEEDSTSDRTFDLFTDFGP